MDMATKTEIRHVPGLLLPNVYRVASKLSCGLKGWIKSKREVLQAEWDEIGPELVRTHS